MFAQEMPMRAEEPIPKWQRIFSALLAVGALVGIFSQVQNGVALELGNSYLLFKLVAGMVGVFLFSCIAIRGSLPFRQKRTGNN